jgi:hypothetical protein
MLSKSITFLALGAAATLVQAVCEPTFDVRKTHQFSAETARATPPKSTALAITNVFGFSGMTMATMTPLPTRTPLPMLNTTLRQPLPKAISAHAPALACPMAIGQRPQPTIVPW